MVLCTSSNIGMLYVDVIYHARRQSSIPRAERAKLRPVGSNNILSDQSESKGTAILSDLLQDECSEFSGKSAIKFIIDITV